VCTKRNGFDPARGYRVPDYVSVRRESFGALVYDHKTRRLLFLKSAALSDVVLGLADYSSARACVDDLTPGDHDTVLAALERLVAGGLLIVSD